MKIRARIIVANAADRRRLIIQRNHLLRRQFYYVKKGDWRTVVDYEVRLNIVRLELYGVGYCGF